jgi:hypothetical protein
MPLTRLSLWIVLATALVCGVKASGGAVPCPPSNATAYKLPLPALFDNGWVPSTTLMGFFQGTWVTSGGGLLLQDVNGDQLPDLVVSLAWQVPGGNLQQFMSCVYLNTQTGWQLVE